MSAGIAADMDTLEPIRAELSPGLGTLKSTLLDGRRRIERFHREGASGEQVGSALTDLCDRVVTQVYAAALADVEQQTADQLRREVCVAAVAGYARGDMAPFSDVDLLFLTRRPARGEVKAFISALVRTLWDAGLSISQSVRTPAECIAFARKDLTMWTTLTERRFICGARELFDALTGRCERLFRSVSLGRLIRSALLERSHEYHDYHAPTVYLLEPNVKKSSGGLRDLHLLRWIAVARYGTNDLSLLRNIGALSERDAEQLAGTRDLLMRIRNDMHFEAGTAQDVLTMSEQVRLSGLLGFSDGEGLLAVERFMQHYYRQTTRLHDIVGRFIERARPASRVRGTVRRWLLSRRVEGDFLLSGGTIRIDPSRTSVVLGSSDRMMELFELARGYGAQISHETLEMLQNAGQSCVITPETRGRFLQMLAAPAGLGHVIRELHRVGLLGRLLPPFEHARCLIQFNQYHKYTIDEHTIRVLEAATRRVDDPGPIGQVYRQIRRKDLLHLAILLHDLGKGLGGDHSEVGAHIADGMADLFQLHEHEREVLLFLVRHHLAMATVAFRRDIHDPQTLLQFCRLVGTPEMLRMLYVLTACDTEGVAPGNLSAWKESLLADLYFQALKELAGAEPPAQRPERPDALRRSVCEALADAFPADWLAAQCAQMPVWYLATTDPARIRTHLELLRELPARTVRVQSEFLPETGLTLYTVFTGNGMRPGIFAKMAGVLAATGLQIVGAQIFTREDGIVMDTFQCIDLDYQGEPPPARRQEVAELMTDVLEGRLAIESLLGRRHNFSTRVALPADPTQVEIDNESSDRFTILEVFADDRQGLLYVITRAIFEAGLSIHSAKISTRLDQVADAFYVTDAEGRKIEDASRLEAIRCTLIQAIDATATC